MFSSRLLAVTYGMFGNSFLLELSLWLSAAVLKFGKFYVFVNYERLLNPSRLTWQTQLILFHGWYHKVPMIFEEL